METSLYLHKSKIEVENQDDEEEKKDSEIQNFNVDISEKKRREVVTTILLIFLQQIQSATKKQKIENANQLLKSISEYDPDKIECDISQKVYDEICKQLGECTSPEQKLLLDVVLVLAERGSDLSYRNKNNALFKFFHSSKLIEKIEDKIKMEIEKIANKMNGCEFQYTDPVVKYVQIYILIKKMKKIKQDIFDFCVKCMIFHIRHLFKYLKKQVNTLQDKELTEDKKSEIEVKVKEGTVSFKAVKDLILFEDNDKVLIEQYKLNEAIGPFVHFQCFGSKHCANCIDIPYSQSVQNLHGSAMNAIGQLIHKDKNADEDDEKDEDFTYEAKLQLQKDHNLFNHPLMLFHNFAESLQDINGQTKQTQFAISKFLLSLQLTEEQKQKEKDRNQRLNKSLQELNKKYQKYDKQQKQSKSRRQSRKKRIQQQQQSSKQSSSESSSDDNFDNLPEEQIIPSPEVGLGTVHLIHASVCNNWTMKVFTAVIDGLGGNLVMMAKYERKEHQNKIRMNMAKEIRWRSNEILIQIVPYLNKFSKVLTVKQFHILSALVEQLGLAGGSEEESREFHDGAFFCILQVLISVRNQSKVCVLIPILQKVVEEDCEESGGVEEINAHQFRQFISIFEIDNLRAYALVVLNTIMRLKDYTDQM
ncbi:MAG: hypothetical protein EZS28_001939 [Streblomastix strix]|uniref:Uncharacterized protein n=1 Tax=Streblomastix strix TaxID=222440 RepID=A0A5J4X5P7_9EUKA|nr:MAG: hypothetical protein EZS28_001939 [Streblomastix strix]